MNAVRLIYTFERGEFGDIDLRCERIGHGDDMIESHAVNLHEAYKHFLSACGFDLPDPRPVEEIDNLDE